jgi:hypothetical protein
MFPTAALRGRRAVVYRLALTLGSGITRKGDNTLSRDVDT